MNAPQKQSATAGKGAAMAWINHHASYDADFCLVFPFYRDPNGYGMMGYLGKNYYAHRLMCETVHGPAPGDGYEAAHSCGNGDGGCCNPRHLSWKTKVGNRQDSFAHGTGVRNTGGPVGRLTADQIMQIKDLKGQMTHVEIAAKFGISAPSVRAIFTGKMYGRESKIKRFTPEEDAKILELHKLNYTFSAMARTIGGRRESSIGRRAKAMGLTPNYDPTIDNRPLAKR